MPTTPATSSSTGTTSGNGSHAAGAGAPASVGEALGRSSAASASIGTLVAEVQAHAAKITGPRPPSSAAARACYEELMAHAAENRGRALLYPYLGSNLGHGALVELADGSVKWDMICGIGVHFFGHSHPRLVEAALRGALGDTCMQGNLQGNTDQYEFLDRLVRLAKRKSRLAHGYLATSGCMANENAIKICYQKVSNSTGGSPRVIAFKDCFMGRSVTMSQIGDAAANRVGLPLSTQVDYMPFYDPVAAQSMGMARYTAMSVWHLKQYIERYPKQHACFIFELVQGEGGFNTAPRAWFVALMDVCKEHGIAVWDDEIQTFGRTEQMFAYEALDLGPHVDVFCVGKMTQVCATLWTPEFNPGPGLLSGTFTGGSVPYAVGSAALDMLQTEGLYGPQGKAARHHALFAQQVRALAARHPAWFPEVNLPLGARTKEIVGGTGGMMRFTPFGGDKDKVNKACKAMFDEGVIVFYCGHGPYHVRMLPPLPVMREEDWPRVFECVERGLAKVA